MEGFWLIKGGGGTSRAPFEEKARRVQASCFRRRGAVFPLPTSGRLPLPRARSAERGEAFRHIHSKRDGRFARGPPDGKSAMRTVLHLRPPFASQATSPDGRRRGNSYSSAVCRPLSRRFVKSAESFPALFAARRRFDAFFGKPTTYWERFFGRPLYRASVDMIYIIIFT